MIRSVCPPRPAEAERMSTDELRAHFLVGDLFAPGELRLVDTGLDRLIAGGAMPAPELRMAESEYLHTGFFHERRETGVINIGDPGQVLVDGEIYPVGTLECLYVGMGAKSVTLANGDAGQSVYYLLSCPAHREYPTRRARASDADSSSIGDAANASSRKIFRFIHDGGIESCQLVMGYTELACGSVWNTWPPHTHARRSEVYLYFGLGENPLLHLMGEPERTRHIVVRDREAILSPPWSIHCGAGGAPYSFIWGMAGENKTFSDMDAVDLRALK